MSDEKKPEDLEEGLSAGDHEQLAQHEDRGEDSAPSEEAMGASPELAQDQGDDTPGFSLTDDINEAIERVGLSSSEIFSWGIQPQDILYLLNRYPFLQIVDSRPAVPGADDEPEFIVAESGWRIYDYGNALSASPGLLMFAGGDYSMPDDDDEGGDGGAIVNPGKGTIVNQAFMTAVEMVRISDDRMWEGLIIVDGHPMMQWAAWAEAYDRGFEIDGYEPNKSDFDKRARIRRSEDDIQELREKLRLRYGRH